jgi:hypothetical protein
MYWLITNRNVLTDGFGGDFADLTFWTAPQDADPTLKASWNQVSRADFRTALIAIADTFPHPLQTAPEDQKHISGTRIQQRLVCLNGAISGSCWKFVLRPKWLR